MNDKWKKGVGVFALLAAFLAFITIFIIWNSVIMKGGKTSRRYKANEVKSLITGADKRLSGAEQAYGDKLREVILKELQVAMPVPAVPEQKPTLGNEVDKVLDAMELGTITFNVPTNINIDDTPQIQLILSLTETKDKLKQLIIEKGEKLCASIRVTDRMEARLSGYMFQITAITPEIQAISNNNLTEWKWEIHPKKDGKNKLHLTLTALFELDGYSTSRAIRSFDKIIEVNITPTQKIQSFAKTHWQWLWATILIPVAGLLFRKMRKPVIYTK